MGDPTLSSALTGSHANGIVTFMNCVSPSRGYRSTHTSSRLLARRRSAVKSVARWYPEAPGER